MTTQEWLENDNKFYHITQKSKIPSILEKGLLRKQNPFGICVIRNKEELILEYLCHMMLRTTDEITFSIIEISPQKHSLIESEIINDNVEEITNPLHNYIQRNKLTIDENDIVSDYKLKNVYGFDKQKYEKMLLETKLIEFLEE